MSYFDDASLVMIPSGYKDQKVYSVKPIDGSGDLTFSRASSATRVNSSGLVEKVRENLILQSNTFSNAAWINDNSTETSGQAGYDGTNNAWLLTSTSAGGFIYQNTTIAGLTTFSVYAKAGSQIGVTLYSAHVSQGRYFNLSTGALGGTFVGTPLDSKIESIGSGWYRCSITVSATATNNFRVYVSNGTANVAGNILIQSAQAETGDIATDYIATTSSAVSVGPVSGLPRLDYSGGASCPSALLEPQRTNLVPFSELYNNATWASNGTVVANQGVSPSGYTDADLFYSTTGTGRRIFDAVTITSGSTYTSSVFAKASGKSFIYFPDVDNVTNSVWFNLSNGTFSTPIEGTATMVDYGNGWYRCSLTTTSTSTTGYSYVGISDASGSVSFTQNGTDGVLLWGSQLELGAYATSYIPTLSTAVTRVQDAASKTGISSLIGQTEGTLFFEGSQNLPQTCVPFQLSDTTNANRVQIEIGGTTAPLCVVTSGGTTQAVIAGSTYTLGQNRKIAVTYKANEFKLYQNGVLIGTDTSGSVPISLSAIYVGSESGTPYIGFDVKQILHFKTALSSTDAITLTTL